MQLCCGKKPTPQSAGRRERVAGQTHREMIETLEEFMQRLGPPGPFKPEPWICPITGDITIYFKDVPSFAEELTEKVTLFKAIDTHEIVGCKLRIRKVPLNTLG